MMESIVELSHVSKVLGKNKIIDDLSFSVKPGEIFGFLGPNGAGKTTTIRMMVGLISINSGEITIAGKSVSNEYEEALRHVGAIVENPELYKFMSGYQNLQQAARLVKGLPEGKIEEVVQLVGLSERIHDKVKTYSLGMRQRLGIAQSLLHDPKVLILDEPTNGLDPAGIREIRDYLRHLAREKGLAVLVSSHLLSEMEMMCDRIAVMQKGKLISVERLQSGEEKSSKKPYFCDVDNRRAAVKILTQRGIEAVPHEKGLRIELEVDEVPDVLRILLGEDLLVFEMSPIKKTLEDRFLEMTTKEEVLIHA